MSFCIVRNKINSEIEQNQYSKVLLSRGINDFIKSLLNHEPVGKN